MFDLEKSIADWRRQMQAAGLKTAVPLEELELHLREDIDRLIKSGLSRETAFGIATRHLGRPQVLKTEFKKNGTLAGKKTAIITLAVAAVMILRVLQVHYTAGLPWHGDQVGWIFFSLLISFWAANTVFFNFNLGDVREVRLWKLAGITFSVFAAWVSLLPVVQIFITPKFGAAFSGLDRILAIAAAATSILSVFGWKFCRGTLPVIHNQRSRTVAGLVCCLAGPGLVSIFIGCFVMPHMGQFHVARFYVLMAWIWTAMAVLGGVGYGLAEAAHERKPLTHEQYV